jgi:hypothetical protein
MMALRFVKEKGSKKVGNLARARSRCGSIYSGGFHVFHMLKGEKA